jgi:hypothetical protein
LIGSVICYITKVLYLNAWALCLNALNTMVSAWIRMAWFELKRLNLQI